MSVERVFQICVSVMAVLATLMLSTSQENSVLPIIALIAAVLALVFTDVLGWFSFHPFVAGTFGLGVGLYAFVQMQAGGLAQQFVSVANLLIHLQLILLFQKKSTRIYWQLITLSLLQVVVAAALNLFVLFGPLLILYTGTTILALIAFFAHRETSTFLTTTLPDSQDPTIQVVTTPAWGGDRLRPRQRLFQLSVLRSYAMLTVSTVTASAAVFLFMPRFGDGVWRPRKSSFAATGFSGTINLDDVGTLLENPSMVMRVSLTDVATGEPYAMSATPYFRGSVSDEYAKGRWNRYRELEKDQLLSLPRPQRIFSAVRQTVSLETSKGSVVFAQTPICALEDTPNSIRFDPYSNEARFFPSGSEDSATYSIGTLSLHNGQQTEFSPLRVRLHRDFEKRRQNSVRRDLSALAELTDQLVSEIPEANQLEIARHLVAFFKTPSNGFKYSLDTRLERKRGVDPVEDFVVNVNHRTGHCQYYASALALMLRSQGISSRVVLGYLGNNYNAVGDYYEIREMDAHAWVEAAIPQSDLPDDEIMPREGIPGDAWVRLDPTPSAELAIQNVTISPWKEKIGDTLDYLQLLWSEYVLGLNEKRQRRAIYAPIQSFFKNSAMMLFSGEVWAARWQALLQRFQGNLFSRDNLRDSVLLVAMLAGGFLALRTIGRFWIRLFVGYRQSRRQKRPSIEFYDRLEKLLAQHGMQRMPEQTPQEFAAVASRQLSRRAAQPAVATIPSDTVDLFYRVRFGGHRLDTDDQERLENAFQRIKEFLINTSRSRRHPGNTT